MYSGSAQMAGCAVAEEAAVQVVVVNVCLLAWHK